MSINSVGLVNQAIIDATSGYGNTRDSLTTTLDQIRDNDVCDESLRVALTKVLTARFNTEIVYAIDTQPITPEEMNEGLMTVYRWWVNACPNRDAGHRRFFSTLSGILCTGPLLDRIPAVTGWLGFELQQWEPRGGRRRRAA